MPPISLAASLDWSARVLISSATTAKPRPASPALAASMEAFKESRLVWAAILLMIFANAPIAFVCSFKETMSFWIAKVISSVALDFSCN